MEASSSGGMAYDVAMVLSASGEAMLGTITSEAPSASAARRGNGASTDLDERWPNGPGSGSTRSATRGAFGDRSTEWRGT